MCWNFLLKTMWVGFACKSYSHFFSAKNIKILYIESAKTVNEMTLNELVKLTTLLTTGLRLIDNFNTLFTSCCTTMSPKTLSSVRFRRLTPDYQCILSGSSRSWSPIHVLLCFITAASSEKVPSSMRRLCGFTLSYTCAKSHLSMRSPLIHAFLFQYSVIELESPDQTAQMRRLMWAFAVRIYPKTRFHMAWHIYVSLRIFTDNEDDHHNKRKIMFVIWSCIRIKGEFSRE